jgi:hypothetical protein
MAPFAETTCVDNSCVRGWRGRHKCRSQSRSRIFLAYLLCKLFRHPCPICDQELVRYLYYVELVESRGRGNIRLRSQRRFPHKCDPVGKETGTFSDDQPKLKKCPMHCCSETGCPKSIRRKVHGSALTWNFGSGLVVTSLLFMDSHFSRHLSRHHTALDRPRHTLS